MITERPCPTHNDKECDKCDFYIVTIIPWNREKELRRVWVGDSAYIGFGPMGMEDDVYFQYVAPL